ncbi:MAG TPA: hypothetical protein VII56_05810 [Rhizomicrobium sp.]
MKIVWIDDDVRTLGSQKRFLEKAGYEVEQIRDVDQAWKRLNDGAEENLCVILDVMMGTGKLLINKPTNGGLRTGREFLRLMVEKDLLKKVKLFVYTIIDDVQTRDFCGEQNIRYWRKSDLLGKKLVGVVNEEFGTP